MVRFSKKEKKMNPKTINDSRTIVWTVSVVDTSRYCLYVHGTLVHDNLPFDQFYPLYKGAVDKHRG